MSLPIPEQETFEKYTTIDHYPFSKYLTDFLNSKSENGYVLNLNAEWGAGKTTFLNCWYNSLKSNHPVIYFDAWKSDFSSDAMLALVDCFQDQLSNPLSSNKVLIEEFIKKGSYFFRKSLPSLAVGYLKYKTNIPSDESILQDTSETLGLKIDSKYSAEAIKEVLKAVCEQREQVNGIKKFKEILEEMAKELIKVSEKTESPKTYPVYVLIDELDRCRPNYAIEVIESIKHFFDTKHFIFVLATDTEQLQHSVKAVYGEGFDAYSYLSRFFHRSVTLPPPSTDKYLQSRLPNIVKSDFNVESPYLLEILVKIFEAHNMKSLREIDKVLLDVEVAKSSGHVFKLLPLVLLSVLKRSNPQHFYNYANTGQAPYPSLDEKGRPNSSLDSSESSSHSKNTTLLLARNWAVGSFHFNENGAYEVDIEKLLYAVLKCTNKEGTMFNLGDIQNENFNEEQITHALEDICSLYRLNPRGKHPISKQQFSMLDDYLDVLELGGHLDLPKLR